MFASIHQELFQLQNLLIKQSFYYYPQILKNNYKNFLTKIDNSKSDHYQQ